MAESSPAQTTPPALANTSPTPVSPAALVKNTPTQTTVPARTDISLSESSPSTLAESSPAQTTPPALANTSPTPASPAALVKNTPTQTTAPAGTAISPLQTAPPALAESLPKQTASAATVDSQSPRPSPGSDETKVSAVKITSVNPSAQTIDVLTPEGESLHFNITKEMAITKNFKPFTVYGLSPGTKVGIQYSYQANGEKTLLAVRTDGELPPPDPFKWPYPHPSPKS